MAIGYHTCRLITICLFRCPCSILSVLFTTYVFISRLKGVELAALTHCFILPPKDTRKFIPRMLGEKILLQVMLLHERYCCFKDSVCNSINQSNYWFNVQTFI